MSEKITWTIDYKDRNKFVFGGSVQANCTSKQLWDLLASPGHLMKVHPSCESHETKEWVGVGSKDVVTYKTGGKRIRTVMQWNSEQLIQLSVEDPSNNQQSIVTYTIKKLPEKNNCELFILMETDAYKKIPRLFWKIYARKILVPQYEKYLQGPLLGFANYRP